MPFLSRNWTLFLDRDGVLNKKLDNDYVKNWSEFHFIPGSLEALKILSELFNRIIIITNQRGIGRNLMSEGDLHDIHSKMLSEIESYGVFIDDIFFCPDKLDSSICRKPNTGMIKNALIKYPDIALSRSLVVGDSFVDMQLAKNLNVMSFLIDENNSSSVEKGLYEKSFPNLYQLSLYLSKNMKFIS